MPASSVKLLLLAASSINMALAMTPVADLAVRVHTPVKAMVDLLNTDNFATVATDDWCTLLQQPVDEVKNWPDDVKEYVFAEISIEISLLVTPGVDANIQFEVSAEVESSKLETRAESIRRIERQALAVHHARMASANSGCFRNWECGACVTAAGLAGTSGIAGCVGAAFVAIGGTAGTSTPIVLSALIECIAKVTSVTVAAIGTCHSLL